MCCFFISNYHLISNQVDGLDWLCSITMTVFFSVELKIKHVPEVLNTDWDWKIKKMKNRFYEEEVGDTQERKKKHISIWLKEKKIFNIRGDKLFIRSNMLKYSTIADRRVTQLKNWSSICNIYWFVKRRI